jgi:ATP-dependent DNA helicase RecQ
MEDPGFFQRLRKLRKQLAVAEGVPPYVVFSDRTLVEISTRLPQDERQLLDINGVGPMKLSRYGPALLAEIRNYSRSRGLLIRTNLPSPIIRTGRRRFHEVGEAFNSGKSINAIAAQFGILRKTVLKRLFEFQANGGQMNRVRLLHESRLSERDRDAALELFQRLGRERLAPVHRALKGRLPYDELHILQLYSQSGSSSGE